VRLESETLMRYRNGTTFVMSLLLSLSLSPLDFTYSIF
jgi:hypothetical protein